MHNMIEKIHRILHRKAAAYIFLVVWTATTVGCARSGAHRGEVDLKAALTAGLARQVVNPAAPADPAPVYGMTGKLSSTIFENRYFKKMTTDENEERENSTDAFR